MFDKFYESLLTLPSDTIWQSIILIIIYTLLLSFIFYMIHKKSIESTIKKYQNIQSELQYNLDESNKDISILKEELENYRIINATLETKVERIDEILNDKSHLEVKLEQYLDKNSKLQRTIGTLSAQLSEERRVCAERLQELKQYHESIRGEFKQIASSVLIENSKQYAEISQERVQSIVEPFRQEVESFRQRVEHIHTEETKEISSLKNELGHIKELNDKLSQEASRLSNALEGNSKTQGIWGEMVLEKVLEISGLKKGIEYDREVTLYSDSKQKFRPDVIVHLPANRDIIIDAKTSLRDYISYINSNDTDEKKQYAIRHTNAIKEHIKKLSKKDYGALNGINNLDLVLMFIPVEGALSLAQETDKSIYETAYKNNIVLVTPSSLLTALRAIEQSWRVVRQNQNAVEIAKQAGKLYDKFATLLEDMQKISRQIDTLKSSLDTTVRKIGDGRENLISQCQKLKELGARTTKEISNNK